MSGQIIFGIHSVAAIIKNDPERLIEIYALKGRQDDRLMDILKEVRRYSVPVQFMHRNSLDDRSGGGAHQGIIAKVKPGKKYDEDDLYEIVQSQDMPLILILDNITDPHNLGACLRTADAAGVDAVIMPQHHSAPLTPTVHKVASGATVHLPIVLSPNLARGIEKLKQAGVWIHGADGDAEASIYAANLCNPTAIVMGAEGRGLRRLTRESCDQLYSLPMLGSVESLNVSVATGLFLYEAVRQRQSATKN